MKVLIIRFSSIGDIVLTTPVVRCLKEQHPEVKVHYLTKAVFGQLLMNNPHIDKLHYFDTDLDIVIEELKNEEFDFVVDLHNNLRTARVKKALDIPNSSFPKLNIKKWLLTNLKLNLMPDKSIVERYFEAAEPIKVHNDGKGLEYFVPESGKVQHNDIPMSHWGGFVGCVIGGSYNTKKLPVAQWIKFCAAVPYPVMLLGGPEDRDEGQLIAEQDTIKIYNSCGKFSLNESADLVQHARVIVSNDTGLMHIAAAYKKPIISLWGNTSPDLGMFPYYGYNNLHSRIAPQSVFIENKILGCHPCSKIGYNKCPKKHFKCMNDLDMQQVAAQVIRLWNNEKAAGQKA
ncbi:MAG: glycosyltransferase family 9 protein [Taibaiella sp.]|nr:glycosyltransferase family 9 protein [Taibaiella sp.]